MDREFVIVLRPTGQIVGHYHAIILSHGKHFIHGTSATGKNAIEAIRNLTDEMERRDTRQAAINSIDSEDD